MKYIITFSMAFVLSLSSMAQTGLVFSQCLTFSGTDFTPAPNNSGNESSTFTVPQGKVWKIEAACFYIPPLLSSNPYLMINNLIVQRLDQATTRFPIWCKAGDQIKIKFTNNQNGNEAYFFSILEFNAN
jgi:hypothetical protein